MPDIQPLRQGDPQTLGDYRVTGRLGEGAQGVVYAADRPDGTRVAIKLLRARLDGDGIEAERFLREVDAARRVAQFCTAQVLDASLSGESPYIVSEYVDGVSLHRVVREEGPRTGGVLHRLAVGTVTALAAIHRAGIVHRDFKPSNVLLGSDGPRVIDFGISRALDSAMTLTSGVVGTPAYMSPEQISGQRVGPPSDMFSWALTMTYAATGRPAFGHDSVPAVIYRVINDDPDLSALPDRLRPIVAACLNKSPDQRPTAADTLFALLEQQDPASDAIPLPGIAPLVHPEPQDAPPAEPQGPRIPGRRCGLHPWYVIPHPGRGSPRDLHPQHGPAPDHGWGSACGPGPDHGRPSVCGPGLGCGRASVCGPDPVCGPGFDCGPGPQRGPGSGHGMESCRGLAARSGPRSHRGPRLRTGTRSATGPGPATGRRRRTGRTCPDARSRPHLRSHPDPRPASGLRPGARFGPGPNRGPDRHADTGAASGLGCGPKRGLGPDLSPRLKPGLSPGLGPGLGAASGCGVGARFGAGPGRGADRRADTGAASGPECGLDPGLGSDLKPCLGSDLKPGSGADPNPGLWSSPNPRLGSSPEPDHRDLEPAARLGSNPGPNPGPDLGPGLGPGSDASPGRNPNPGPNRGPCPDSGPGSGGRRWRGCVGRPRFGFRHGARAGGGGWAGRGEGLRRPRSGLRGRAQNGRARNGRAGTGCVGNG
ncbi:serine/threonine protein kinase [Thermocatellispora tengchongensis]